MEPLHNRIAMLRLNLPMLQGMRLVRLERFEEAEAALFHAYDLIKDADKPQVEGPIVRPFIALYEAWDRPQQAAKWRERNSEQEQDKPDS